MSLLSSLQTSVTTLSLALAAIVGSGHPVPTTTKADVWIVPQSPQLSQITESPEFSAESDIGVDRVAVLAAAFAGSAAIGLAMTTLANRDRSSNPTAPQRTLAVQTQPSFSRANPALQRKLMRLIHEDRSAASRLLTQAQLKYPGKSPDWYLEKVIFDLQRDRGRY